MRESEKDTADIDARIAQFKKKQFASKPKKSQVAKFWENALRIATEFVAPILIGISIGYLLDKCFDTRVFFMLILAIFGLAAGMLNVYRAAQQMEKDINGSE